MPCSACAEVYEGDLGPADGADGAAGDASEEGEGCAEGDGAWAETVHEAQRAVMTAIDTVARYRKKLFFGFAV